MADNLMTPEEIQQLLELVDESAKSLGHTTQWHADMIKDAQMGIRGYSATQRQQAAALKALGKDIFNQVGSLGATMLEGKTGLSTYNSNVENLASSLGKTASQYGMAGKAFGGFFKILSFVFNQVSGISDALYKSNQEMSQVGLGIGMKQIFDDMHRFGYGVNELGDMTSMIQHHAEALAIFGQSAEDGYKKFVDVAGFVQHSQLQAQFMQLGMSVDDINNGIARYLERQNFLGTQQNLTQSDLKSGVQTYLINMSNLSKVTGQSADQLQREFEKLEVIDSFVAKLSVEMEAGGERKQRAEGVLDTVVEVMNRSQTLGLGIAQSYSGYLAGGEEAFKAYNMTGGALNTLTNAYGKGEISHEQFLQGLRSSVSGTFDIQRDMATIGAGVGMFPSIIESQRIVASDLVEAEKDARESTKGQMAGNDALLAEQVKLRQKQMASRDSLQTMFSKGISPLAQAFTNLNNAVSIVLRWFGIAPTTVDTEKPTITPKTVPKGVVTRGLGPPPGFVRTSNQDLSALGLRINVGGDVQKSGAVLDQRLIELAKQVQVQVPGFRLFTSFNDTFHNTKYPTSEHALGRAIDFVLDHKPTEKEGQSIVRQIKAMGADFVLDEYNHPSPGATAGHIHVQFNSGPTTVVSTPTVPASPTNNYKGTDTTQLSSQKLPPVNAEETELYNNSPGYMAFLEESKRTADLLSETNSAVRKTAENTQVSSN